MASPRVSGWGAMLRIYRGSALPQTLVQLFRVRISPLARAAPRVEGLDGKGEATVRPAP